MRVNVEWEADQGWVDRLFLSDTTRFGEDDFEVVVRCMFKHDRGLGSCGIGGDMAQRSGFLERLIRMWDRPLAGPSPSIWSQVRSEALKLPSFVHALDPPGWCTATVRVRPLVTNGTVDVEIVRDDGQWAARKLRATCRELFEPFPYPGWNRITWPQVSFKVLRDGAERSRQFDSVYSSYGPWVFYAQDVGTRLFHDLAAHVDA